MVKGEKMNQKKSSLKKVIALLGIAAMLMSNLSPAASVYAGADTVAAADQNQTAVNGSDQGTDTQGQSSENEAENSTNQQESQQAAAETDSKINLTELVVSGGLTLTLKDTTTNKVIPTDSNVIGKADNLEASLSFELANDLKKKAVGKSIVYDLSSVTSLTFSDGTIHDRLFYKGNDVGDYTIEKGLITLNIDSNYLQGDSAIGGNVTIGFSLSSSATEDQDQISIPFPGTGTITAFFPASQITGTKTHGNKDSKGEIPFEIDLSVDSKSTNVIVTDTLGSDFSFDSENGFFLDGNKIDSSKVTIDDQTASFSWEI